MNPTKNAGERILYTSTDSILYITAKGIEIRNGDFSLDIEGCSQLSIKDSMSLLEYSIASSFSFGKI